MVNQPKWIWGDDTETTVFAQGYGTDSTVIFSFSLDRSKASTSLSHRICTCMHGLLNRPTGSAARVVFAIYHEAKDSSADGVRWNGYQNPLFQRFISSLADEKIGKTPVLPGDEQVDFASLISEPGDFVIFKGIDFRTFLTYVDEKGDKTICHMIHCWHRSNRLLRDVPRHPNVLPPAREPVTSGGQRGPAASLWSAAYCSPSTPEVI
ncbi:nima-related kinase 5 [Colletotrichum plurivorum]|uniref:Nima-related kinase 5 n=1 Tax=Colletotrichum plurivorum TaxID=2175906 RepID=A0A8H6KEN3_9PEZI|nr:nima-related kinase 5 [Colletotrichum plurivorum]